MIPTETGFFERPPAAWILLQDDIGFGGPLEGFRFGVALGEPDLDGNLEIGNATLVNEVAIIATRRNAVAVTFKDFLGEEGGRKILVDHGFDSSKAPLASATTGIPPLPAQMTSTPAFTSSLMTLVP